MVNWWNGTLIEVKVIAHYTSYQGWLFEHSVVELPDTTRKYIPGHEILVENKPQREKAHRLRRALIESGRLYQCEDCGNKGQWNEENLVLEVDHKNGNWSDCREENLSFVCPNCHSLRTKKLPFRCKE